MNNKLFSLTSVLGLLALAGCGVQAEPATARSVERFWTEEKVLFRLDPAQGVLSAYGLRNGILPLGDVRLPAGWTASGIELDAQTGRILVSGDQVRAVVDARSMRLLAAWREEFRTAMNAPEDRDKAP